jgi:hypothetical protein
VTSQICGSSTNGYQKYQKKFIVDGKSPPLSKLQQDWLSKRHDEGRHVAVILGLPEGVILLDGVSWQNPIDFTKLVSREEAAKWIVKETVNECIKPAIRRSKNNDTNL